jgi:glutaredoxin-related protein
MPRAVLPAERVLPAAQSAMAAHHADVLAVVQAAVEQHPVVVLGMGGNPFVSRARKALDAAGVAHTDLDYGNYFSQWRLRTAIKMWSGWPTLPMVFVRGNLVGGATDLEKLIASGELKRLLAA